MPGKRALVTLMGYGSTSDAHTGVMPCIAPASGKPPEPSNKLPSFIPYTNPASYRLPYAVTLTFAVLIGVAEHFPQQAFLVAKRPVRAFVLHGAFIDVRAALGRDSHFAVILVNLFKLSLHLLVLPIVNDVRALLLAIPADFRFDGNHHMWRAGAVKHDVVLCVGSTLISSLIVPASPVVVCMCLCV